MPPSKSKRPARKAAAKKAPKPKAKARPSARAKAKAAALPPRRKLVDSQNWHEVLAIICSGLGIIHFLALISYSVYDLPSWVPGFTRIAGADVATAGNYIGPFGAVLAGFSYFLFGGACFLIPAIVTWFGAAALMGFDVLRWRTLAAAFGFLIAASGLIDLQTKFFVGWIETYQLPKSEGGLAGYIFSQLIIGKVLGPVGGGVVFMMTYLVSLILLTGFHPFEIFQVLRAEVVAFFERRAEEREMAYYEPEIARGAAAAPRSRAPRKEMEPRKPAPVADPDFEPEAKPKAKRKSAKAKSRAIEDDDPPFEPDPEPKTIVIPAPKHPEPKIIDANERKPRPKMSTGTLADTVGGSFGPTGDTFKNYQLPSLDLLAYDDEEEEPTDKLALLETQQTIIDSLGTFGVKVTAGDITRGPSITRYEVYPSKGLSVKKITTYEADLARATKAERINILAPIPGKDTVGIEIANSNRVLVPLRELFEDPNFLKGKAEIPLALGKDVYGKPVIADLASMPHLLVAGATGSGKSVCINSIIASLLFRFTPEELRFIMIDPKVVEMQIFNTLPHLAVPVVTNPKKVLLALRWCLNEMERRYEMFAKVKCRKLEEFNNRANRKARPPRGARKAAREAAKAAKSATGTPKGDRPEFIEGENVFMPVPGAPEMEQSFAHAVSLKDDQIATPAAAEEATEPEKDEFPERLPYVVVIIDELADLMQTSPADVETAIARLCGKARAAGIHLIVATQSPRVDVVTGLIKANIPARIAFQVASSMDSRVILDKSGAEKLVGKGDMLYQPPDSPVQVRSQGAFLTEEEVTDIVDHCAAQAEPVFESDIQDTLAGGDGDTDVSEEDEETLEKCLDVIMTERKASTSFLQRRLRLGYTRAARMMDILEERGVVGPGDGAKPREILVDLGEEIA
ncbi:MAG: S-DNA-T family DNA segregation ATPase FtsK/SpoIIIE [Verrucomicrobiales bacterium]|jgi:S-DNA-T family DNA segregation ATPase FtsK/SpoIIIE